MAIIHIDMDGITHDFLQTFLDKYNERAKESVVKSDITVWNLEHCLPDKEAIKRTFSALNSERFWSDIPLLAPNIPQILESWNDEYDVYLLSSPWNGASCKGKWDLVEEYFPFLNGKLALIKAKHLVKGDLLIDDKPLNLKKYHQHNSEAKLATIAYPYNLDSPDSPVATFYAYSYKNPEQAWNELDEFVKETL